MKTLVLPVILAMVTCLSSCATVDPVVARQNANIAAAPYVEAALTQPIPELYQKAVSGDAHDAFRYGLGLLSGRDYSPLLTPEDKSFLINLSERIDTERTHWHWEHPNATEPFVWEKQVTLNGVEMANLERLRAKLTPHSWIMKAALASKSRQIAIYVPPVTMGGAGRVQLMTVSDPVIGVKVVDAGVECMGKVRVAVGDKAVSAFLIESIAGAEKTSQVEADEIHNLLTQSAKMPVVSEDAGVCGSPESFTQFVARLKTALDAEKSDIAPAVAN